MPKIRVLADILASQVAAGEVVERPSSVVKELVENSIDAGAREVRVDTDQGGAALIRVSDDGCGMSRDDALLSLERHATSKLRSSADLAAIRTLGFRGEAMPSIASVSRFRMITRERESVAGTEITVDGGKIRDVRDAGCAPGTVIEAKALFFNMPARRKFLRGESTEAAHIEHQLRLHALAAPWVRFRFRRNDREVFDFPAVGKSVDRVRQLLGPDLARDLIQLPGESDNGVALEGFLLPASHARKGRRHQFVFLNGRPIEDPMISRALAEGFRGALAEGMHPAAWLWIDLDPTLVDVNVHPAKREVRFHRPLDLKEIILRAVSQSLRREPVPVARPIALPMLPSCESGAAAPGPRAEGLSVTAPAVFHSPQPVFEQWREPVPSQGPGVPEGQLTVHRPEFRVLGMIAGRYVVMESQDGLVMLDPKAAFERVMYERLLHLRGEQITAQGLLVPVLLELDPRDYELLLREQASLAAAGIEVAPFGGNTVQITSLPACLELADPRTFLGEWLDEVLHGSISGSRFTFDRLARLLARRASASVVPRLAETDRLLGELFACELPYCTADGRPTLTEWGLREIERRFGVSPG